MADIPQIYTTTVLRKRKRSTTDRLTLHLSASPSPSCDSLSSESDCEPPILIPDPSNPSGSIQQDGPPSRRNGNYRCTFQGCGKAYSKPSRLAEHERAHTGDRPFSCSTCQKPFLRETHLQAHIRSHLPNSARPFVCEERDCDKRFWTAQHLRAHSELHKGDKPFKCLEPDCGTSFMKNYQLRDHICTAHAPPGTKPYRCEHKDCTKSFTTSQKLRAHVKIHDDKRYTCIHPDCLPTHGNPPNYLPTWSALQHHLRIAHPPTCPHVECNGKTFTAQKGLRAHLKLHEQRELEDSITQASSTGGGGSTVEGRVKKRRRGGEVGRDWACEMEGCGKDFKSKKALRTHHAVTHLGLRDHTCPHSHCQRAFAYKHLLQRHLAKLHAPLSEHDTSDSSDDDSPDDHVATDTDGAFEIDLITGNSYIVHARERMQSSNTLRCPHPDISALLGADATSPRHGRKCEYVFARAYDFRRHLIAEHGVEVEKERVDEWVKHAKQVKVVAAGV